MTDAPYRIEDVAAALAVEPAFASFAKPHAGILIWDAAVERLLWASPAAEALRHAVSDAAGRVEPRLAVRDRLRALAAGLAPHQGMRLERLRLDPARLAPPTTCACRLVTLRSGEVVLVTAVVGAVPQVQPRLPAAQPAVGEPPAPASEPTLLDRDPPAFDFKPRGTIRFVWQADADARFVHVSPSLAEVVGPMAADIVGQTWSEISRSVVEDLDGSVAALFARRETWSGRVIHWQIDNCTKQVPVDWAGMPIFGPSRELTGFRGFGLIRTDAVIERDEAPETQAYAETPEAPLGPGETDGSMGRPSDDETVPGQDIEEVLQSREAAAEVTDSDASDRGTEEGWFAGIRERVAATLSGSRAPRSPDETEKDGQEVRPRAKSPDAHAGLSTTERSAFREIARALGARFEDEPTASVPSATPASMQPDEPIVRHAPAGQPATPPAQPPPPVNGDGVLDRLPVGVLVHRGERILFANRLLLDLVDYDDIGQIGAEGGVVRLFRGSPTLIGSDEGGSPLALSTRHSESIAVEVRLTTVEWDGLPASLMLIRKIPEADATQRLRGAEMDLRRSESRMRELESILDTATDGVIVLDETGRMLSLNRSAEALFGYDQREVVGDAVTVLLAPESHIVALDYLEGLRSHGVASLLNDGREVQGRVRQGGTIPLFMTMGHVNDGPDRKFCAVLRDITAFKKAESELVAAKRVAEEASAQKSDLLAKISHEIRTPLNAIIGFAEVMLEERFGPIGNDRYKDYLRDVHGSGAHVISLVNDLLDLAKIEAGRMDLSFTSVSLNDLVSSCVTLLQPQAGRDRIVMRTSFAPKLPPVVADERSIRQIVLNLVSNAIKFTDAGGQVIVSTALTDRGEVAFRVRDTGIGMTEKEIEAALEPFRQLATSRKRGGTGLGLPLTKALVEANRGALQISSNTNEGTLVEVLFPPTRVLAE